MPTILTPPDIERRNRPPHEGDNGHGRRPPTDKRTGGNGEGDGDNYDAHSGRRRGPRDRLSRARIGVLIGLGGVIMLFTALVTAFLLAKANGHWDAHHVWVNTWKPIVLPRILLFNSALLLLSSVTAEIARRSMFREADVMDEWIGLGRPTSNRATAWLSATLLLGLAFLAGQFRVWTQIASARNAFLTTSARNYFNLLTETHAAHLTLGILALITTLTILQRSRTIATRQVFVDATVLYWHAMGLLWLILYALLEFGQ
ncbi:MAG: heme-copper oxidase subunit III [Acidobacteriota bacterium]